MISIRFCLAATLVLASGFATAAPITISDLYSTGVDNLDEPLGNGLVDSHYSIVSAPAGYTGGSGAETLTTGTSPLPTYIANGGAETTSRWIRPVQHPSGSPVANASRAGSYVYETTFTTSAGAGNDLLSVTISGKFFSDDSLTGVNLNGNSISLSSLGVVGSVGQTGKTYTLASGGSIPLSWFNNGVNTLQFVVLNGGAPGTFSPTAFRNTVTSATFTATPEPTSLAMAAIAGLMGAGVVARRRKNS